MTQTTSLVSKALSMPLGMFLNGNEGVEAIKTAPKARGRKAMLLHLAALADADTGFCWASNSVLSEAWGLSLRSIQYNTSWMVGAGLIERIETFRPDGAQATNIYILRCLITVAVDVDAAVARFQDEIGRLLCGPNFDDANGEMDTGDESPVSLSRVQQQVAPQKVEWWETVRSNLKQGAYILRSLGYDELLQAAEKDMPPSWLKRWMVMETAEGVESLAKSPGFMVYWISFLYSKKLRRTLYTSEAGMLSQLRRMLRLDAVSSNGTIDRKVAAQMVLMSILNGWVGLPQESYLKTKPLPELVSAKGGSQVRPAEMTEAEIKALVPVAPQIGRNRSGNRHGGLQTAPLSAGAMANG